MESNIYVQSVGIIWVSNVEHLRNTIFTWHKMGIICLVQHDCVDESVLVQEKQTTVDNSVHRALLRFVILHKL